MPCSPQSPVFTLFLLCRPWGCSCYRGFCSVGFAVGGGAAGIGESASRDQRARATVLLRAGGGHVQAKRLLGANRSEYRLVDAAEQGVGIAPASPPAPP